MAEKLPTHELNDGARLPGIGFGTLVQAGKNDADTYRTATLAALENGYRLLDTALRYENEQQVGQAIRESGVNRDEITVTTKIPGRYHGYEEAKTSVRESLDNLGLDRLDLVLIHWPLPRLEKYVETFQAMIELRDEGLIGSVGVSNFLPEHLDRVKAETGVMPAVNQIEMHPYFNQAAQREYHREHGIVTESWSPLGRISDMTSDSAIVEIAQRYGVSPAQAVLRWHIQHGSIPIPASAHSERQQENLRLDFELDQDAMATLDGLERGRIWDQDPTTHEEF